MNAKICVLAFALLLTGCEKVQTSVWPATLAEGSKIHLYLDTDVLKDGLEDMGNTIANRHVFERTSSVYTIVKIDGDWLYLKGPGRLVVIIPKHRVVSLALAE